MFISTLTEAQNDVINKYSDEFDIKTKSYNLSEYHRTLYIIARILKPEIVIETGVFEGHSSLALLLALKENNKGHLHSIDVPSPKLVESNKRLMKSQKPLDYLSHPIRPRSQSLVYRTHNHQILLLKTFENQKQKEIKS